MAEAGEQGGMAAVLGPTRLAGRGLTGRQRAVVAALALHAGRPLEREVLIDAVWDGRPPAAARQSLQNQIARIRREHGADVVVTTPGGYRLGVPTDVETFESTVAPLLRTTPHHDALSGLTSALALWRGTPFADLGDVPGVEAERARLSELRAEAAEQLVACRLQLGDVATALGELPAMTVAEPYRERRWALLMTALVRDGRPAEALGAFDRMADVLARELGIEPSAPLRRLRQAVQQDGTVDLRDSAGGLTARDDRALLTGGSGEVSGRSEVTGGCRRHRRGQKRQRTCSVAS